MERQSPILKGYREIGIIDLVIVQETDHYGEVIMTV